MATELLEQHRHRVVAVAGGDPAEHPPGRDLAEPRQLIEDEGLAEVLLRETDRSVTDVCFDVGFTSLGTFSRTFRAIVGETPSGYRAGHGPIVAPHCVQLAAMRPLDEAASPPRSSSFGEAAAAIAV